MLAQVAIPRHESIEEPCSSDECQMPLLEEHGGMSTKSSDNEPERLCLSEEICSAPAPLNEDAPPPACLKAIQKMGLERGALRALVMQSVRAAKPSSAPVVQPDSSEASSEPTEEIMVRCTPQMISLLSDDCSKADQLRDEGVPLLTVMRRIRSSDSAVRAELSNELASTSIKERRRRLSSQSSHGGVDGIRQFYAERQYQRMLSGQVGGCINALRRRTEDRFHDQGLIELRQSVSIGVSALVVLGASFLVGYYWASYVGGVRSHESRLLAGACSAAAGGLIEAVLITLALTRMDERRTATQLAKKMG